jgi:SNF2 family DNA or RNA helicase
MLFQLRKRHSKKLETAEYKRTRASISLQYGNSIEVRLRMPASAKPVLRAIGAKYFDADGLLSRDHFGEFSEVLDALRKVDEQAVIYSDVLDYIDRENELSEGLETERKLLAKLKRGQDPTVGVLKTKLLPYQVRGAVFAACRGRVVLADDMGLGKTVQALAGAELLRRGKGIEKVLVIAPASVKYQWKTEIEKFTNHSAQVIDATTKRVICLADVFQSHQL